MRLALATLLLAACAEGRAATATADNQPPPRPAGCQEVAPGELVTALAAAADGASLCLAPGIHPGPLRITRPVELWGGRDAIIQGTGPGSVVVVTAVGARVAGLTIDGTGGRFEVLDAAIHVIADDVVVEGVQIVHAVYGILAERTRRVTIRGNHVRGDAARPHGLRGDTIRLWETHDSVVADNLVEDGRDMVVWYSRGNRVTGNRVVRGRYGTHFMYSDDNVVEDNQYLEGVVGVFVMYSRGVELRRNLIVSAGGAAGMAIGLKDSNNITVEDNVLIRDATGLFIDQTPGRAGDTLVVRGNAIHQCDVAITFHTTPARSRFEGNDFGDNLIQVNAEAGIDPSTATWLGNHWGDYVGYDLDGDGTGDVPYQSRSASEELVSRHPQLGFFRGGAVLGIVDAASKLIPMWPPRTLLVDPAPRMSPRDVEEILHAR